MDKQTKVLSTIFFCLIFVCFTLCGGSLYDCPNADGASVYYADNCYAPSQKLDLELSAPVATSQASTNTKYQTTGNTLVRFINLKSGVQYYFSTCDETNSTPGKSKFNTILILRDPSGNVLASNDDCTYNSATSLTCSMITYSHGSNNFNQAYLLVIYKKLDPQDGDYICGVQSSSFRSLTTVAAWASSSTGCSFDLVCKDFVYKTYANSVNYNDFIDGSSDLCGGTPYVYINGAQKSNYECSDIGEGTATLSLYGKSCTAELYVYPISIPQPTLCADNTNKALGYKVSLVYPTPFDSHVEFMSEKPLFTLEYAPYVEIFSIPCVDPSDYLFDLNPSEVHASIGDVVYYDIIPFTPSNQAFDDVTCEVFFAGVQPTKLFSLDDPDSTPIFDEGTIYFNTPYQLDYFAALPDLSVDISVYLYNGTGNLLNPSFYYIPAVKSDNNCGGGTFTDCESYSTFCIPSDSGIEDGYYQILFIFDSNYLDPVGCGIPGYVVIDPSDQQGEYQFIGKRNIGVPSKMISLGNPTVLITSNPDPDRVLTCYT